MNNIDFSDTPSISFGALPKDLNADSILSSLLRTLNSLLGFVTEYNLHCSNGGSCLTTLPENVDTILGANTFVNAKSVAFLTNLELPATTGLTASLDPM